MLSKVEHCNTHSEAKTLRSRISVSSLVLPGIVVTLDGIVIILAALATYITTVAHRGALFDNYLAASGFVFVFVIVIMQFAGLYKFNAILRPLAVSYAIVGAFATAFLFLLAAAFSLKITSEFSRIWVASFAASACGAVLLVRFTTSFFLRRLAKAGLFARNLVVLGEGAQLRALLTYLAASPPSFSSILGVFVDDHADLPESFSRWPILGRRADILNFTREHAVDDVFIALPWSATDKIKEISNTLREMPLNVYLAADLVGLQLSVRPAPEHYGTVPVVELMGRPLSGWGGLWKTVLDYGIGIPLVVVLSPAMLLIAIAIKIDSRGPVLFKQARYGFVNRVFEIYKFRTMKHEPTKPDRVVQSTRDDPRVTPLGRLLRRTSLDELPQLFNVLNGTMSLVGPRPHAIDHNEEFAQQVRGYFARHRVKPGLTGWAQVNGLRGEIKTVEDIEERVRYDTYYVENWSVLFDLKVLVRTLLIVITGRNAY
jgi:Undecaprenyl-phosphate glucose phosphotransferase